MPRHQPAPDVQLGSLPWRDQVTARPQPAVTLRGPALPRVSTWVVLRRLTRWSLGLAVFAARLAADRLRGPVTERRLAQRLRELFERLGGTAVKLGQQLSIRVDMLPFEVCRELGSLVDRAGGVPLDEVRPAIEAAAGRPLDEVYAHIDPSPVGSASIATVFRARLLDGREVAIKVRRPGAAESFQADLTMFNLGTRLAELATLVRPGWYQHVRTELWSMFTDELDFRKEADFQTLFRRTARESGLRWLTAPRVHMALCSEQVLVSDYVEGVPFMALLEAVEHQDAAAIERLSARGIRPKKIAARITEISQWGRFEAPFFHADPHPGNILLQDGGRVVMLDFGACGRISEYQLLIGLEMNRFMLAEDWGGAGRMALAVGSPLPPIDVEEATYIMQDMMWRTVLPHLSGDADWWERTSAAGFLASAEVARDLNIQINAETLRSLRGVVLYETLVSRIDPDFAVAEGLARWKRRALKRAKRRFRRELDRRGYDDMRSEWEARIAELRQLEEVSRFWRAQQTRRVPGLYRELVGGAAYGVSQVLHAASLVLNLGASAVLLVLTLAAWRGASITPVAAAVDVATHPLTWLALAWIALGTWRRVNHRLRTARAPRG